MEHQTSDDLRSSVTDKTVSASYCAYTRPSLNGYTVVPSSSITDKSSDADQERVGVFDYVLSYPQDSNVVTTASTDDPDGTECHQSWTRDGNSIADSNCGDAGTELTTFYCSGSSYSSAVAKDTKSGLDNFSELEEVVVHSGVQPRHATYERFDPEFPYRGIFQSSATAGEPSPVFITSINKTDDVQCRNSVDDASDERDVIQRRSHQSTLPREFHCFLTFVPLVSFEGIMIKILIIMQFI